MVNKKEISKNKRVNTTKKKVLYSTKIKFGMRVNFLTVKIKNLFNMLDQNKWKTRIEVNSRYARGDNRSDC